MIFYYPKRFRYKDHKSIYGSYNMDEIHFLGKTWFSLCSNSMGSRQRQPCWYWLSCLSSRKYLPVLADISCRSWLRSTFNAAHSTIKNGKLNSSVFILWWSSSCQPYPWGTEYHLKNNPSKSFISTMINGGSGDGFL